MQEAADGLVERLKDVPIREPGIPFYSNVTGGSVQDPEQIRDYLGRQVISSVLWETSMRNCLADGIEKFIEPGPGKVLRGLLRKIAPEAECESFDTP
jgi:[acyl-carrier-protein] S-malonyltransferase